MVQQEALACVKHSKWGGLGDGWAVPNWRGRTEPTKGPAQTAPHQLGVKCGRGILALSTPRALLLREESGRLLRVAAGLATATSAFARSVLNDTRIQKNRFVGDVGADFGDRCCFDGGRAKTAPRAESSGPRHGHRVFENPTAQLHL